MASESFNKANSTTLGPDLTWVELGGATDLAISGNKVVSAANGVPRVARADVDIGTRTMFVQAQATFTVAHPAHVAFLGARLDPSTGQGGYYFSIYSGGTEIFKFNSGGTYSWLNGASFTITPGQTYDMTLVTAGNWIGGFVNGVEVISAEDTTYTGTYAGFGLLTHMSGSSGQVSIDNWSANIYGIELTDLQRSYMRGHAALSDVQPSYIEGIERALRVGKSAYVEGTPVLPSIGTPYSGDFLYLNSNLGLQEVGGENIPRFIYLNSHINQGYGSVVFPYRGVVQPRKLEFDGDDLYIEDE